MVLTSETKRLPTPFLRLIIFTNACAVRQVEYAPARQITQQLSVEANFRGDEPFDAAEQIKRATNVLPKLDQYSTSAEKQNYVAAANALAFKPFRFVRSCLATDIGGNRYNSATQSLNFQISTNQPHAIRYADANLNLASKSETQGTYEASNAFGARTTVVRKIERKVDIEWKRGSGNEPMSAISPYSASQLSDSFKYAIPFKFSVRIPPAEAREHEKNITCVLVFRPTPRFLHSYVDSSTPSIRSPLDVRWEGTVLIGRIGQLWVINKQTGKVYAQFD